MEFKQANPFTLLIAGIPLLLMGACSGGSSADVSGVWKAEYGIEDGGDGKKIDAPPELYFQLKEDGTFRLSQGPGKKMHWVKKGDKIKIYKSEKKEKKDDTWEIKKVSKDSLKILSKDKNRVMVQSASDKSFDEVAK